MNEIQEVKQSVKNKLEVLGFKAAAVRVGKLAKRKRQMAIAYEHYRFVRDENIQRFNSELYEKTRKHGNYQILSFTPVEQYEQVPPDSVLNSLEAAINRQCFDKFEVAHIVNVKDPILFGRIDECTDRFYIDQWDDDVKISDLLKENEG